jgi:hypothetical protein
MQAITKQATLQNGVTITVESSSWLDKVSPVSDGVFMYQTKITMHKAEQKIAAGNKIQILDASNKFDAEKIKQGGYAQVGSQVVSKSTYDVIIDLINQADSDEIKAAKKQAERDLALLLAETANQTKSDAKFAAFLAKND